MGRMEQERMSSTCKLGGWDVHTHLLPPAVIDAGEKGLYGMRAAPNVLHVCAHGVPIHPLADVNALVDRIGHDGLDGAVVSVPPPLFRPDLDPVDQSSYTRLINDSLLSVCHAQRPTLRPFAYLPIENPELAAKTVQQL